jgi:hypothetical protein
LLICHGILHTATCISFSTLIFYRYIFQFFAASPGVIPRLPGRRDTQFVNLWTLVQVSPHYGPRTASGCAYKADIPKGVHKCFKFGKHCTGGIRQRVHGLRSQLFSLFSKNEGKLIKSPVCLCLSVCPPLIAFESLGRSS